MSDAKESAAEAKEIRLRYQMVDGVLQIDILSQGLDDDPDLIAMHLALALDRMSGAGSAKN